MPIQEQNIVFVKSQVMDDVPEGGGAATGVEIPDGVMNNVFEDISDLDRAYGRLKLRKIFLAVRSLSTDLYGGAKTVITALPADPALSYTLFTTNDPFDTRQNAADRVAAYLYKGPIWHGVLNENHIAGMRAISVIQRVDTELPIIGETLCLVQDEGLLTEVEQYVRVIKAEAVTTTFEDQDGEYLRWIVRLDLSDALRTDFLGHTANRYENYNYTGRTRLRRTTVADATRYYSSQPLTEAAGIGDLAVRAAALYTQLVPSAQTETPLVGQTLAAATAPLIASRANSLTYTVAAAAIAPNGRLVVRTGALPGSLSVTLNTVAITDDGAGRARYGSIDVGLWDYAAGECQFNSGAPTMSGTATVTYIPAVAAPQQAHTRALPVTAENRRLNWIETLLPIPAPGAFELAYLAQGNWYPLADNRNGGIVGSEAAFGSGTLSYVTGEAAVTLGALPDVGSQILYTWGSPVHSVIPAAPSGAITVALQLPETPVADGSLTLTWEVGGVERSITDADGALSGTAATGRINYLTGQMDLTLAVLPDHAAGFSAAYQSLTEIDPQTDPLIISGTLTASGASFSLGRSVVPGALRLLDVPLQVTYLGQTLPSVWSMRDGGNGLLYLTAGGTVFYANAIPLGTINYQTGAIAFTITHHFAQWNRVAGAWEAAQATYSITPDSPFTYSLLSTGTPVNRTATFAADAAPLRIALHDTTLPVVTGSASFLLGGKAYVERNGVLYADPSPTTGSGTVAGALDLLTGIASVTWWTSGVAPAFSRTSLLTRYGDWTAIDACFRTAARPLKPESLSILAVTTAGATITGQSDPDGVIAGAEMRGAVHYEFGTARVEFGHLTGETWTPVEVDPATIRYNAVAYTYLPLDANLLGIDAVRLPPDGRVPIYRAGDVVMILHADDTTGTPAQVGGTGPYRLACGRTRLAWIKVTDANGAPVTEGYTLDRAAGVVSWESIAGLATPVTVRHTVGDLRLVTDAQISGRLTLARALTHDFPADDSLVAACLIQGDRRARVSATWDQATWDGAWTDGLVGSAATATLNTIDFPITVTNEGCDTDRWLLRWLTTTTVELISEKRGRVWSGEYPPYVSGEPADIAPINPRTRDEEGQNGVPYLTIPQKANGGGWSAGNVARINTVGAIADFWIAQTILQSDEPEGEGADGCELYALGNIDRP